MVQPIEIKMQGTEYVGYYFGREITRQKSLVKALYKLHKYVKGQE